MASKETNISKAKKIVTDDNDIIEDILNGSTDNRKKPVANQITSINIQLRQKHPNSVLKNTDLVVQNNIQTLEPEKAKLAQTIQNKIKERNHDFTDEEVAKIFKKCRKCKVSLSLDKYYKNATGKLGRHATCIVCFGHKIAINYAKKRKTAGKKYKPLDNNIIIIL